MEWIVFVCLFSCLNFYVDFVFEKQRKGENEVGWVGWYGYPGGAEGGKKHD